MTGRDCAPATARCSNAGGELAGQRGAHHDGRRRGRDVDAGPEWPAWARAQLDRAAAVAAETPPGASVAATLYRDWFAPRLRAGRGRGGRGRPLAGIYRAAHAGTASRVQPVEMLATVGRHDVIGGDGWWRTWGRSWTPPRSRPGSVRILLTVDPERLGDFVRRMTTALVDEPMSWSLAVSTDGRRVGRAGAAVLDLPGEDESGELIDKLVATARPALLPVIQPLCRPLAPGAGLAQYPDNGMTFGEHRCYLVALGLRRGDRDPLACVASVFAAHGIDPAHPYRSR